MNDLPPIAELLPPSVRAAFFATKYYGPWVSLWLSDPDYSSSTRIFPEFLAESITQMRIV